MPLFCIAEGCKIRASYGLTKGKYMYCKTHSTSEMFNVRTLLCAEPGCIKQPVFGHISGNPIYCIDHKTAVMHNVKSTICAHPECFTRPSFNIIGETTPKFCNVHKQEYMIDITFKHLCIFEGCNKKAYYNISTESVPKWCHTHKTIEMKNKRVARCKHTSLCCKIPVFGVPGGKPEFCFTHKSETMINLKQRLCHFLGCRTHPTYGFIKYKPISCGLHKSGEMNDVTNPICTTQGCIVLASFGNIGGKPIHCAQHKSATMINLNMRLCKYEGCKITSTYGFPGAPIMFCNMHKSLGMINRTAKICEYKDCKSQASFGRPGLKKTHCAKHRQTGMIRRPTARCSTKTCKSLAIYGTNWTPKHCEEHHTEDEQNLVERPCSSCGLSYVLDSEDRCESCNPEAWATARLAKQNALMDALDARGLTGETTDRMIDGGVCGRERPDRVFDLGDKILVLECDEHQHRDRPCLCEQTRMINIAQSFGGIPTYFIRWNPDDYCPQNERKHPEILIKRHKLCGDLIRDIQKGKVVPPPQALSAVIYLYYDEWDGLDSAEWTVLMSISPLLSQSAPPPSLLSE